MKKHILLPEDVAPGKIIFDDLILDPDLPLESQAEWELKEDLFGAKFPNGCLLDVGWLPPHSPTGEFVLTLSRASESHSDEGPFELVTEKRCRSIAEMLELFKSLAVQAKRLEESDLAES